MDAGERGEVAVAVEAAGSGRPLSGQGLGDCHPCRGDYQDAKVSWYAGGAPSCGRQPVRLRIRLRSASLYSFWIG